MVLFIINSLAAFLLCFIASRFKGLKKYSLLLFNFMWLGGLALSNLGLFNLYKVSFLTNVLFFISIVVFNIVLWIFCKNNKANNSFKNAVDFKIIPLFLANIIVLAVSVPFFIKAIGIYSVKGMTYLRSLVYIQSPEYISNTYLSLFFQWIIQPFIQFFLLVVAYTLCNFKKSKKTFLIIAFGIIDLLFETFIFGGGRRTLFTFLIELLLFALLVHQTDLRNKQNNGFKKIFTVILLASIVIVILTSARVTEVSVLESVLQYYIGPFVMFDKITLGSTGNCVASSYGYGLYSLSFIIVPIGLIGYLFFHIDYNNLSNSIMTKLNETVVIGNHSVHNAHATSMIYFYSDFGFYFSFIGMILMALIICYFINRAKSDFRHLLLGVYFCCLIFNSAQTYPFTSVIQYVIVFYTYVFIPKPRAKKYEKTKEVNISYYC